MSRAGWHGAPAKGGEERREITDYMVGQALYIYKPHSLASSRVSGASLYTQALKDILLIIRAGS